MSSKDIRTFFGVGLKRKLERPRITNPRFILSWNADGLYNRLDAGKVSVSTGERKGGIFPHVLKEKLQDRVPDLICLQETHLLWEHRDGKPKGLLRPLLLNPKLVKSPPPPTSQPEPDSLGLDSPLRGAAAAGGGVSVNVEGRLDKRTKLLPDDWADEFEYCYWSCSNCNRKSGTAVLSRIEPVGVEYSFPGMNAEFATEGRYICAEFEGCFVVNIYSPNTGDKRLDLRADEWDRPLLAHLIELETKGKPVIFLGDLNVSPTDNDLTHPSVMAKTHLSGRSNNPDPRYKPQPGVRLLERQGFQRMLDYGFIDAFRYLHPESRECSWRARSGKADAKGMRLDFFMVSRTLASQLVDSTMFCGLNENMRWFAGSDHCAITLELRPWSTSAGDAAELGGRKRPRAAAAAAAAVDGQATAASSVSSSSLPFRGFDPQQWVQQFAAYGASREKKKGLRKEIATQTIEACRQYGYMHPTEGWISLPKDYMLAMARGTTQYRHNADVFSSKQRQWPERRHPCSIEVVKGDCIDVALKLKAGSECFNPVVLNMANLYTPDGGWLSGAGAQEESIFRRTNYCQSLLNCQQQQQAGLSDFSGTPINYPIDKVGGIYSPGVICFRANEQSGYAYLPAPVSLPYIAVAAIQKPPLERASAGQRLRPEDASKTTRKLAAILSIGLEHGHDCIVLSAFGCGAFKNPPAHIAQLCHELLNGGDSRGSDRGSSSSGRYRGSAYHLR